MDQDLAVLRGEGGGLELTNRLTQQVGRLDFTVEELQHRLDAGTGRQVRDEIDIVSR